MIELTEQQRQVLSGPEPKAVDSQTNRTYVLVSEEVYQRLKGLIDVGWDDDALRADQLARLAVSVRLRTGERQQFEYLDGRSVNVERMCHLAQVSRSGFYRYLRERWPAEEEITLRSAIQDLVLEHCWRYGYRRVTVELRQRGMIVNRKRVARLMREDNLLTVRDSSPSVRSVPSGPSKSI